MRAMRFSILTFSFVTLLFIPHTAAQDYTKWSLPEGATARLGKGRMTGEIAYSPDGNRLAVVSSIGIWIYDAHTGTELDLLTDHTDRVGNVVFNPDGTTLAGGSDREVRLWDARTGEHIATLTQTQGV